MKKILIVCLSILVILFVGVIIVKVTNKDESENLVEEKKVITNTNDDVISEKIVNGIRFYNIKYTYDGEKTVVILDIENRNDKKVRLNKFLVNLYDESDNLIGFFEPILNLEIDANAIFDYFQFEIAKDYSNAYRVDIILDNMEFIEEG